MMCSNKTPQQFAADPGITLKILVIIVLGIVTSSGIFLHIFGIDFMNYLPTVSLCPFHAITGLPCPGCGMTRAMLRIGQLKFEDAIGYNLFSLPLVILMFLFVWQVKFPSFLRHKAANIVMFTIVIFFWLMRLSGLHVI